MQLTADDIVSRVRLVQSILEKVMIEGTHYGFVGRKPIDKLPKNHPKQPKPSLMKPGAELIGMTFQLGRKIEKEIIHLPNNHREVIMKCTLFRMSDGAPVAEAYGSCSTMESKYRYRSENMNVAPPEEWWKTREHNLLTEALGREGQFSVDKKWNEQTNKTDWVICEKVEVKDPADVWNTVLKMSEKRAYVGAILAATACSDMFSQEEDPEMREHDPDPNAQPDPADAPAKTNRTAKPKAEAAPSNPPTGETMQGWEAVVIHWGTKKGKRLGDLSMHDIEYYAKEGEGFWNPNPKFKNVQDDLLKAASKCAYREMQAESAREQAEERQG